MSRKLPGWVGFFGTPRFHLIMCGIWIVLLVPSLLFWPNSVLWVIFLSLYANFASHFSAYQGARSEQASQPCEREHVDQDLTAVPGQPFTDLSIAARGWKNGQY